MQDDLISVEDIREKYKIKLREHQMMEMVSTCDPYDRFTLKKIPPPAYTRYLDLKSEISVLEHLCECDFLVIFGTGQKPHMEKLGTDKNNFRRLRLKQYMLMDWEKKIASKTNTTVEEYLHSWQNFDIKDPMNPPDTYDILEKAVYSDSAVQDFLCQNGLIPKEEALQNEELTTQSPGQQEPASITNERPFQFHKTGPTWEIVFEGRKISGLRDSKGLKCLHYLISNKDQNIGLADFLELEREETTYMPESDTYDFSASNSAAPKSKAHNFSNVNEIMDDQYLQDIKEQRTELEQQIQRADEMGNEDRASELAKKLNDFDEFVKKHCGPNGKTKFPNEYDRQRERVAKNIRRALEKIKEYDESTYEHFMSAIGGEVSFPLSYSPVPLIEWSLSQ